MLERPTLPAATPEPADWVKPAPAAVMPENVRGLSKPLELALAEREPNRAAPALAGLCFGLIPAARPPETKDGRLLPKSTDVDAAKLGRIRSLAFLGSDLACADTDVFVGSAQGTVETFKCEDRLALPQLFWAECPFASLSTVFPAFVAASDCMACSADDWRERDGSVVVLRRNEGRLLVASLLVALEGWEATLSVEEDAAIWDPDREGHIDGCGALGVSTW